MIQLLLELNANVNATPAWWRGRTALQAASENGHLEAVRLLLEWGADVNAVPAENHGITPLEGAIDGGHL